jgi:hypothetical protein
MIVAIRFEALTATECNEVFSTGQLCENGVVMFRRLSVLSSSGLDYNVFLMRLIAREDSVTLLCFLRS